MKESNKTGKITSLIRSTSLVASLTMLSRVLGLVRDVILAQTFGASAAFDAFVVAFKIPNFMRRLFADGAFSQALVPVLAEYRTKHSHAEIQTFINRVTATLSTAILLVVILVEIFAPLVIMVFAPGFSLDPHRHALASHMLHITFPYLLLIALVALSGAVLNTYSRFGVFAFTPTILNITLIAVAWLWVPYAQVPIYTLAWGVFISGILQLLIQLPFLHSLQLFPRPQWCWSDPWVRRVMVKMVPALFGVSVAQVSALLDNLFASFLPAGSISWLYYSDRFVYLPLGVIGVALATVVMPSLARQHSLGSTQAYRATLDWAVRCVILIGLPAALGLIILSGPILTTVIHHGAFSGHDVLMVQRSLIAYSVGLPAFMLIKILASAFYARQDIGTPVRIAVVAVTANLILNVILVFPLAHAGLALGTALSAWLNAALLLRLLIKRGVYQPVSDWSRVMLRVGLANGVMSLVLWWSIGSASQWLAWGILNRTLHLIPIVILGFVSYLFCLWVTGLRLRDFRPPVVSS